MKASLAHSCSSPASALLSSRSCPSFLTECTPPAPAARSAAEAAHGLGGVAAGGRGLGPALEVEVLLEVVEGFAYQRDALRGVGAAARSLLAGPALAVEALV